MWRWQKRDTETGWNQKKYGRKIRFHVLHKENWATLESLDPEIKVKDILLEYDLPTYDEQIAQATEIQDKHRSV